jgi:quercetin dioxygenase-like cupin family protein
MHLVRKSAAAVLTPHPTYARHGQGYSHASLVDHVSGSVHTGLSMNQLAVDGSLAPHVHSYEEGFYILEGAAEVTSNGQAFRLGPGDFGVFKVGTPHAWRNAGAAEVRWLQMAAPQPKPAGKERDTFFLKGGFAKDGPPPAAAKPLGQSDPGANLLGHFDVSQIPSPEQRAAGVVGSPGVFLKWMIDEAFGARHHRMLFIEYLPGANIPLHDHTFEEAYFILSGEVHGTLDGEHYVATAGEVLWTGVGCVHSFANKGSEPVRWIETFSPQPPAENVFRFMAEWEKKALEIEG